jgi:transposase-like protein
VRFPRFSGVSWLAPCSPESGSWNLGHLTLKEGRDGQAWVSGGVPAEVLDLVEAGRPVLDVARDLGISAQSIYTWRQDRIDKGLEPGLNSAEKAELTAAKRRIAELETELAILRRASELIGKVAPPKGGTRPSR